MKKNILSNLLIFPFLVICSLLLTGCLSSNKEVEIFKSNFKSNKERSWIGPEYWSNPLQDWKIVNGELECLVSKTNRNVHLLTKKLDTANGDLKMKVSLRLFNTDTLTLSENWVGFSIGSKGKFNDYRDNAVFGKGLNVGITTKGNLFIGELPEKNTPDKDIQKLLKTGLDLDLSITYKENKYDLLISILDKNSKSVVSQLMKSNIAPEKIIGDLVLVSHYNLKKNNASQNKKSVAFKDWEISGSKIKTHNEYAFGPILFSQYTLSKNILKLTAQMAPVILSDEKVNFQVKENNTWKTIDETLIDKDARTAIFRIENWNTKVDIPYRLAYKAAHGNNSKKEFYWKGIIRKDPTDKEEIVIAGFTGNDHLGFPNSDITTQVKLHNPDILFFSGDQIYEPNGGFGAQRFPIEKATLDYLRKWYMYGWAFRDLMKDRPTVSITDDHDVYHGNIWGEAGRPVPSELGQGSKAQDFGGYKMPAQWVNMVERTQTSHLPDPFDPTPVAQGIGTYYTDMSYGGISFAILEDRKFKSAPKALLPKAEITNGWALNRSFDMGKNGNVPGAQLLGNRQLLFLDHWVSDWSSQAEMKVLLSQTIFANVATLPAEALNDAIVPTLRIMNKGDYPPNDRPVADLDSNGWPQSGRDRAVEIIRKGFVFHLAGDQHLGSTIQYGVEEWGDSSYAFCVPSISNHWPRRWFPNVEGENRKPGNPKYTGEYKDGFGNKITVNAISNPIFTNKKPSRLYDRATGYGIVRLNKKERNITLECWPRLVDPKLGDLEQYEGWPLTINQVENYGRKAKAYLPEIKINGLKNPVVQIINEQTNEIIYSLRLNKSVFTPKIFDDSIEYTVKVGEPDENIWQEKNGISIGEGEIIFSFK